MDDQIERGDKYDDEASLLEKAASQGNLAGIEALLAAGVQEWDIQQAFELAADAGYLEIAGRLIQAGADYNFNYGYDHGEGQRCPVCYRQIMPGAVEICEHWICTREGREFSWYSDDASDFSEELTDLYGLLEELDAQTGLDQAPPALNQTFRSLLQHDTGYWTYRDGVIEVRWSTGGMLNGSGFDYFHPDAGFAKKLKAELRQGIDWLGQRQREIEAGNPANQVE